MAVATVRIDAIAVDVVGALERESEPTLGPKRPRCGRYDRPNLAEVAQRVRGRDDVIGGRMRFEAVGQLVLDQLVVNRAGPSFPQHSIGQIDAGKRTRERLQQHPAQSCTATRIEHIANGVRRSDRAFQCGDEQFRRAIVEAMQQHVVEALGELVEGRSHEIIRGSRRHVSSRARGEHVRGDRVARVHAVPRAEHRFGLFALAGHIQRASQELVRAGMARIDVERAAKGRDRLRQQFALAKRIAEIDVRFGHGGRAFHGLA